ncbi:MAG: DUF1543 domain-containing protein [Proteobacteria bacterium]|nr:DUF1543 domain-containing protein [Pseudomonadota bacterium]
MKLFALYIGGSTENSLIELHDARFIIANDVESTHDELKKSWWGTPDSLHIDCVGELTSADGHNIHLKSTPSADQDKLYFVNLGGYDPEDFTELHKNIFVIAPTESKAKVRALKTVQHWKSPHKDYMHDVENIFCINDVTRGKPFHIHLEKTDSTAPFTLTCKYTPLGKKRT